MLPPRQIPRPPARRFQIPPRYDEEKCGNDPGSPPIAAPDTCPRRSLRLRGGGLGAGGAAEGVGSVGLLPGEVVVLAAEVAVGGGLLEDRAVEVEVLAEGTGAHVELALHQPGDLGVRQLAG